MKIKILSWDAGDNGYEIISAHNSEESLLKSIELTMRRNMDHFNRFAYDEDFSEVNELLNNGLVRKAMNAWNTAQHDWMGDSDEFVYLQVDEIEVTE